MLRRPHYNDQFHLHTDLSSSSRTLFPRPPWYPLDAPGFKDRRNCLGAFPAPFPQGYVSSSGGPRSAMIKAHVRSVSQTGPTIQVVRIIRVISVLLNRLYSFTCQSAGLAVLVLACPAYVRVRAMRGIMPSHPTFPGATSPASAHVAASEVVLSSVRSTSIWLCIAGPLESRG